LIRTIKPNLAFLSIPNNLEPFGGTFHCLPKRELKELEEIFRSRVLAMLKAEGRINGGLIEKLMARHYIRMSEGGCRKSERG
jgi:hypothetical protein